jgi:hypothetical protein
MFDNPLATPWPPPPRPVRRWRPPAILLGAMLLVTSLGYAWRSAVVHIVSSPSRLRQIEVVASGIGGGETLKFFLHNAGYRLPHRPVLVATAYGASAWSVAWQGPNAVRIGLSPGWTRLTLREPAGVQVAVVPAP